MKKLQEVDSIVELIENLKGEGIHERDYHKYVTRYLEMKAREKCIPLAGHFELTPMCNLDCKMCYVHLDNTMFDKMNLLPPEIWKDIIQSAFNAGMRRAYLTGGECLIYPWFDDIYLYLYKLGIKPGILSNGVLMNEERVDFFKQYPPRMIQITLYGSSENAYENVTGHRVFQLVYDNICLIRDANIPVKVTITPSIYMERDFAHFLETVESLKVPYFINANLISPRSNTGRATKDISVDDYVEIYKTKYEMNKKKLIEIDPAELPDENHLVSNRRGLLCGAGKSSFGIKYDGSMCPCLSLPDIIEKPLLHGFHDAWKAINFKIMNKVIPFECGDCIYLDRCLPCIAMHEKAPYKGHCDPRICERTKKLIASGIIPKPSN